MQKVRTIKKNHAESLEYNVGDILSVEGTWYGGVNAKGRSGIPLSLDREEYEEYRQEPQKAARQEERTGTQGRENGGIDPFSYQLGVMDCFCEMVSSGVKRLAMSHPFSNREERDHYREEVKRLCEKYGILFYPEEEALLRETLERRRAVGALFEALRASGAKDAFDVLMGGPKAIGVLADAARNTRPEAREVIIDQMKALAAIAAKRAFTRG